MPGCKFDWFLGVLKNSSLGYFARKQYKVSSNAVIEFLLTHGWKNKLYLGIIAIIYGLKFFSGFY